MSITHSVRRVPSRAIATVASVLLVAGLMTALTTAPSSAAGDPCGSGGNKIACENSKPGTPPSVWDIDGAGDDGIQGFSTDISVNVGSGRLQDRHRRASTYTIDIYRSGYYSG